MPVLSQWNDEFVGCQTRRELDLSDTGKQHLGSYLRRRARSAAMNAKSLRASGIVRPSGVLSTLRN